MARMADAFMKGYAFVDDMQRKHKADERLEKVQGMQDTLYNQSQEDRTKRLNEEDATRVGLVDYVKSFSADLPKEAQTEQGLNKMVGAMANPEESAKVILDWSKIEAQLEKGQMPEKSTVLEYLNTAMKTELDARFGKNGLNGKLVDLKPTPDGKGIFLEAEVTDQAGKTYRAPLTQGAGTVNDPGSGQHPLQVIEIKNAIAHGASAAHARMFALVKLAESGLPGAKMAIEQIAAIQKGQADLAKELRGTNLKVQLNDSKNATTLLAAKIRNSGKKEPGAMTDKTKADVYLKMQKIRSTYEEGQKIKDTDLETINYLRGLLGSGPLKETVVKGKADRWWPGNQSTPDTFSYSAGALSDGAQAQTAGPSLSGLAAFAKGDKKTEAAAAPAPVAVKDEPSQPEIEDSRNYYTNAPAAAPAEKPNPAKKENTEKSEDLGPVNDKDIKAMRTSAVWKDRKEAIEKIADKVINQATKLAKNIGAGLKDSYTGVKEWPEITYKDITKIVNTLNMSSKEREEVAKKVQERIKEREGKS